MFRFFAFLLAVTLLGAAPLCAGELAPGLQRQLDGLGPAAEVRVLVVLREQAAVQALDRDLRFAKAGRAARHAAVVGELKRTAARSQGPLLQALAADKAAGVRGWTPHWLVNAVSVTATPAAVRALADHPAVARIEADLVPELIAPVGAGPVADKGAAGVGIAPGVAAIGARRVWNELGYDGSGVLVGLIDSGADLGHPAYASRWQGNFAPAGEAWLDAAQFGHPLPMDTSGHGTHVLGIMAGVAPGDTIGVAPGARWIATNGIQAATGIFDNAIMASLEFMVDPDGDPTTSDDVPDVVNNSWGINEAFAGYLDCDSRWWDLIDNAEAAGIVMVWAAGNEGPIAGTVRSPADRAANPYNCFSVGATNITPPFVVADFSSRGPSGCGGPYAIKPEIVAPGDSVYSALPGGGYITRNGTSMAAPHVAGVVALMRQANPDLDVTTIKDILMTTARDLGPVGEDNVSGHGALDAYAAVQAVLGGIGTVAGTVTDAGTGQPVAGAEVRRVDGANLTFSDAVGRYSMTLYAGPGTFRATAFGYFPGTVNVTVPDGGTVAGDITLIARPTAVVSGVVTGPDGLPVPGASVRAEGTPVAPAVADTAGFYSLVLPGGAGESYTLRAVAPDLGYRVAAIDLQGDLTVDFALPELTREDFESGSFVSYPWTASGDVGWVIDAVAPYEGSFCARSGDPGNAQSSGVGLDYFVAEPGELSFWLKVSSEPDFDFFRFLIDGQIVASWSGEVPWTRYAIALPRGNVRLDWVYEKDEAFSTGLDNAWLDFVEFPVTGTEEFPAVTVSVPSVTMVLEPGGQAVRTLAVGNAGGWELNYTLAMAPIGKTAAAAAPVAARPVPETGVARAQLAKGAKDLGPLPQMTALGTGGPDAYGYTWTDSDEPDGPPYVWEDIGAVGTPLTAADDYSHGPVDLGFPFVFYGQSFGSVRVSTNGFLSFTSTSSPYVNPALPAAGPPDAVVAPFWDDLDPTAGGSILVWDDPDADRFIVQYEDVPRYGSSATETFQVVLSGSGAIDIRYKDVAETGFCTVGIEDPAGTDGLTVVHNTGGYVRDGLALRFAPPGFLPWVAATPLAGRVAPGEQSVITLSFDAGGLALGTHVATLGILSDDPQNPVVTVPLILTVEEPSGAPDERLPRALTLAGAVPNPFNPRTEIRFAVPRAGHVALRVHDVRGRLVRTLVDGRLPAGPGRAVWDGRDAAGRDVASGTYFVRLVGGGEARVRSMTLIR